MKITNEDEDYECSNRSTRRSVASQNSSLAATVAMTKTELNDKLLRVEMTIQSQSRQIYILRSQYKKDFHQMQTQFARSVQFVQDMSP